MKKISYLALLFGALAFTSCKQTQEVIYDPANVEILVLNDSSKAQSAAEVRMYDDLDAYSNSKENGVYEGFTAKATTDASGKVTFTKLNPDKEYYFLVEYRDRARFVDLNNYDNTFKFTKNLSKGSNSFAEIQLNQAKSVVGFYVPANMQSNLPVKLYLINDTSAITITSITNGVPTTPTQSGVKPYRFSAGTTNWYAKSYKGCFWSGQIKVGTTESFTPIGLSACYAGSVGFKADSLNKNNLPIKVTLNNADVIGTIYAVAKNGAVTFEPNVISAARDTGTYNYTAESLKSNCVWQGKVKITNGATQVIVLPKCN